MEAFVCAFSVRLTFTCFYYLPCVLYCLNAVSYCIGRFSLLDCDAISRLSWVGTSTPELADAGLGILAVFNVHLVPRSTTAELLWPCVSLVLALAPQCLKSYHRQGSPGEMRRRWTLKPSGESTVKRKQDGVLGACLPGPGCWAGISLSQVVATVRRFSQSARAPSRHRFAGFVRRDAQFPDSDQQAGAR